MRLNKKQQLSLKRKWQQNNNGMSYLAFRKTVQPSFYDKCVMVKWCGMWLGIEEDGYTHS